MLSFQFRRNVSLVLFLALIGISAMFWSMETTTADNGWEDGVYEGVGQGFNGDIKVSVTVSGGRVTDIEVLELSDTPGFGDRAAETLIPLIIEAQDTEVDVASGASYSSKGIIEAVENALGAGANEWADGTYTGTGQGFQGEIVVEVEVADGKIAEVTVVSHSDTPGISDKAIEQIPARIVESQSLDVDTVSGATWTSEGIIEAAKNALNK